MIDVDRAFQLVVDQGDFLLCDFQIFADPPDRKIVQAGTGPCAPLPLDVDQAVGECGNVIAIHALDKNIPDHMNRALQRHRRI